MATVVLRAVEVLGLTLPTLETKQTILTEVLQPCHNGVGPLLPFIDAFSDILVGVWAKPCTRGANHTTHLSPSLYSYTLM